MRIKHLLQLNIQNNTKFAVASNTFYQLLAKVITMSITMLTVVIVTKFYGVNDYGEFNLMQSIPALIFIIADFGLNAIAVREISKDYSKAEKYFGNVLVLRMALSLILIGMGCLIISMFPYSYSLKFGIYLAMLLVITQGLYATTNIIFQAKLRYDLSAIGLIAGSVAILMFVLIFWHLGASVIWINFSYVLGGLITFFINLYFLRKFIKLNQVLQIDKKVMSFVFIQALPLGIMFVFSQLNFKADAIILSVLPVPKNLLITSIEATALYGLGYKIFEVALVIPTFFMNAMYPIYVRHLQQGKAVFKKTFIYSTGTLFLLGLVGSIVGIFLAPFMINVLGGEGFSLSIVSLRLLLIGLPIFYITQPIAWLIVTVNYQKLLPIPFVIASIFNIAANLILIPKYSFLASSVITWISELLILVILSVIAYYSWKHYDLPNKQKVVAS